MTDPIVQLVHAALDEVNELLAQDQQVSTSPETPLMGPSASLDSVGLVNLVVAIEQLAEQRLGCPVGLSEALADDDARAQLSTVGGLIEYVRTHAESKNG